MPRQIGNLISRFFYDGKLKNPDISILPNFDKDKFHGLKLKKKTVKIYDTTTSLIGETSATKMLFKKY